MSEEKRIAAGAWRANWRDSLLAVLLGNVIYFLILEPRLPAALRHEPLRIDSGLWLDFAICLCAFLVLRLIRKA